LTNIGQTLANIVGPILANNIGGPILANNIGGILSKREVANIGPILYMFYQYLSNIMANIGPRLANIVIA